MTHIEKNKNYLHKDLYTNNMYVRHYNKMDRKEISN